MPANAVLYRDAVNAILTGLSGFKKRHLGARLTRHLPGDVPSLSIYLGPARYQPVGEYQTGQTDLRVFQQVCVTMAALADAPQTASGWLDEQADTILDQVLRNGPLRRSIEGFGGVEKTIDYPKMSGRSDVYRAAETRFVECTVAITLVYVEQYPIRVPDKLRGIRSTTVFEGDPAPPQVVTETTYPDFTPNPQP